MLPGLTYKERKKRRNAFLYKPKATFSENWDRAFADKRAADRLKRIRLAKFKSFVARDRAAMGKLSGIQKARVAQNKENAIIRRALVNDIKRVERKESAFKRKKQGMQKHWGASAKRRDGSAISMFVPNWITTSLAPQKYNKWLGKEPEYVKKTHNFVNRGYQDILTPEYVKRGVKAYNNRWIKKTNWWSKLSNADRSFRNLREYIV